MYVLLFTLSAVSPHLKVLNIRVHVLLLPGDGAADARHCKENRGPD